MAPNGCSAQPCSSTKDDWCLGSGISLKVPLSVVASGGVEGSEWESWHGVWVTLGRKPASEGDGDGSKERSGRTKGGATAAEDLVTVQWYVCCRRSELEILADRWLFSVCNFPPKNATKNLAKSMSIYAIKKFLLF